MPKRKKQDRGKPMAFFFYEREYPDMRGIMDELKQRTGKKNGTALLHVAARRMLRQERERGAAIEKLMKEAE